MPLSVEANRALQSRTRLGWIPPRAPDLRWLEDPEDSPEDLRKLLDKVSRKWPSRSEQEETRSRRPPPIGAGYTLGCNSWGVWTGISGSGIGIIGPIGFPYYIERAVISARSPQAAGVGDGLQWTVLVSNNDSGTPEQTRIDQNVIVESPTEVSGVLVTMMTLIGQQLNNMELYPRYLVPFSPSWIKVPLQYVAGTFTSPGFAVDIRETTPVDAAITTMPFIMPRFAPRPPLTRRSAYDVPRFVNVRVLQGGKPMFERPIPWFALDPKLKSEFLSSQAKGEVNPHLQPIW